MDTPLTLDHAINMAGLIQATAHWLLTERPLNRRNKTICYINSTVFQACARYGLEGVLTDVAGDRRRTADDMRCVCWIALPPSAQAGHRQRH